MTHYILAALICFVVGWTVAASEALFREPNRPAPFRGRLGMLLLLALAAVGAAFGTGGILWIFRAIPSSAVIVVIGGAGWLGFAASSKLHGAPPGAVNRLILGLAGILLLYGLAWKLFPPPGGTP